MAGGLLVLFLGMYSWNQRTHTLDDIAANVGLEMSGTVLGTFDSVKGSVMDAWRRYVDLVGVREENERLRAQVAELQARIVSHGEDLAELARLRELVQLPVDSAWKPVGARILAGRMGPNAIQDSITINRGYTSGARPGTPIVTNMGLVGRVLRASPHAATVLLITDPGSRIAVFAQQSRSAGILSGQGLEQPLEVGFVERDAPVTAGEILITSGLDGKYPKGIPVATVDSVAPSDSTQFLAVTARPLVDVRRLEEVLLLEPSGINRPLRPSEPAPDFVGPPRPPKGSASPCRPCATSSGGCASWPWASACKASSPASMPWWWGWSSCCRKGTTRTFAGCCRSSSCCRKASVPAPSGPPSSGTRWSA